MPKTQYTKGVLQYIPFFYVIWSDDLLSASEIAVVKANMQADLQLTAADRDLLSKWLNRDNPPSDTEIKAWKKLIENSGVSLVESETYPLTEFSKNVAAQFSQAVEFNENLAGIEVNLGMQPNHYNHLFDVAVEHQVASTLYEPQKISALRSNSQNKHTKALDELLGSTQFQWSVFRDKEAYRLRVLEQLKILAKHGFGALAYPKEYGGENNMPAYGMIFEKLMYVSGSLAVKFGVQFGLFGGSIANLGTREHWDTYLSDTGSAELLGCFAMTETRHGSNVRGIRTTATYDHDKRELVIHTPGEDDNKEYIGNALHASMATVFAQLIVKGKNEGVHAVLVPVRNGKGKVLPGVRIEDNGYKLGLNGVDNGKIWFNQVRVPVENLLNRYGSITSGGDYKSPITNPNKRFFTMLGTLVGGRICVAKGALAGAKMALNIAVNYALQRRQFNNAIKVQEDLIMEFPSHQLRLTPAVAASYVFQIALDSAMEDYHSNIDGDTRKIETQVAGLKGLITWFAMDTLNECRQACGGKGYLLENRIAGLMQDVDIFTTFEGDNTVLMQLAAKGVLSDFKAEFNSDGFLSVLRFLTTRLNDKLTTFNPIYANKVDKDHLYNPKFHLHAFDFRTRRLTYSAGQRIRAYLRKGISSYQAFLKVQTHLINLGNAYSIELAYQKFTAHVEHIKDPEYRDLYRKLGTLYALYYIRKDASWYLEQGYIGGTKSKAIRQRVERLSSEFRPHIKALVEGMDIPKHLVTAPIAR